MSVRSGAHGCADRDFIGPAPRTPRFNVILDRKKVRGSSNILLGSFEHILWKAKPMATPPTPNAVSAFAGGACGKRRLLTAINTPNSTTPRYQHHDDIDSTDAYGRGQTPLTISCTCGRQPEKQRKMIDQNKLRPARLQNRAAYPQVVYAKRSGRVPKRA